MTIDYHKFFSIFFCNIPGFQVFFCPFYQIYPGYRHFSFVFILFQGTKLGLQTNTNEYSSIFRYSGNEWVNSKRLNKSFVCMKSHPCQRQILAGKRGKIFGQRVSLPFTLFQKSNFCRKIHFFKTYLNFCPKNLDEVTKY